MSYPGASHTFTVKRKVVSLVGHNLVNGGFVAQSSGIYINLRPMNEVLSSTEAGIIGTGVYEGATSNANDIKLGDLLSDETENDKNGNPVEYQVQSADHNFAYLMLRLQRTSS